MTSPLSVINKLKETYAVARVQAGEIIISEGEVDASIYILISGELQVFTAARSKEIVLGSINPNEVFGELSLDGGARSASVRALANSECIRICETQLDDLMSDKVITTHILHGLIKRLRRSSASLRAFAAGGVYERVVSMLMDESSVDTLGRRITKPTSQQSIADKVGASREMVNRVLMDLCRGGYLARGAKKEFVILRNLPKKW